ncbi:MAG TPA: hypothetical protein VFZ78_11465 [Flavisolibacter sp.]
MQAGCAITPFWVLCHCIPGIIFEAMHPIFTHDLSDHEFTCACGWHGKGPDTAQEYLLLTDATELFCPQCHKYFGMAACQEEVHRLPE